MAPKSGTSKEEKLETILTWFRDSRTCHPLKDLEAPLAKAAGINKMQVKDFLKELTDENKVRVEKIGSVNWYWCWAAEEARERKAVIAQLETEIAKVETSNMELQSRLSMLKDEQSAAQTDTAHKQLLQRLGPLEEEVKGLTIEKDQWENAVAGGVENTQAATTALKMETNILTDNISILEAHLLMLVGWDKETLEGIRREFYGDLYVEGEGLADIEGL